MFLYENYDSFYIVPNICILGVLSISNYSNLIFFLDNQGIRELICPTHE